MRRVPEYLGVYEPTTKYSAPPDRMIPYAEGKNLVDSGNARFVNHGNAIAMRRATLRAGSFECNQRLVDEALGAKRSSRDRQVA